MIDVGVKTSESSLVNCVEVVCCSVISAPSARFSPIASRSVKIVYLKASGRVCCLASVIAASGVVTSRNASRPSASGVAQFIALPAASKQQSALRRRGVSNKGDHPADANHQRMPGAGSGVYCGADRVMIARDRSAAPRQVGRRSVERVPRGDRQTMPAQAKFRRK